jgi:uncharacterized protein (TIGR02118 family)
MIKVSVLYPNRAGSKFDVDYYLSKHIPMLKQKLGSALKSVGIEQGIAGGQPGTPATYSVMCHLTFDSVDAFLAAFGPVAAQVQGDIANYSNVEPVVQISEVKM